MVHLNVKQVDVYACVEVFYALQLECRGQFQNLFNDLLLKYGNSIIEATEKYSLFIGAGITNSNDIFNEYFPDIDCNVFKCTNDSFNQSIDIIDDIKYILTGERDLEHIDYPDEDLYEDDDDEYYIVDSDSGSVTKIGEAIISSESSEAEEDGFVQLKPTRKNSDGDENKLSLKDSAPSEVVEVNERISENDAQKNLHEYKNDDVEVTEVSDEEVTDEEDILPDIVENADDMNKESVTANEIEENADNTVKPQHHNDEYTKALSSRILDLQYLQVIEMNKYIQEQNYFQLVNLMTEQEVNKFYSDQPYNIAVSYNCFLLLLILSI